MLTKPHSFAAAAVLATAAPSIAQDLYATDFSDLGGWTIDVSPQWPSVSWAVDATPAVRCGGVSAFRSAPSSLNFNDGVNMGFEGFIASGTATSPPIDLSTAAGDLTLEFWLGLDMEIGCEWDRLTLNVIGAASGSTHYSVCLNVVQTAGCGWERIELALDPAWGDVQLEFDFNTWDHWANWGAGAFIDDLRVHENCAGGWVTQCEGERHTTGIERAVLVGVGSTSHAANEFVLRGAFFPTNTFAMAFYGPESTGISWISIGNGHRCISPAGSVRLPIRSTHATGTPVWGIDQSAPPTPAGQILAGSTWYFQAIYRDGASVNFSDAIRVTFCD